MVFHLGVLKYFSEMGIIHKVDKLSTVSGGSLVIGLILSNSNMEWPSGDQYLNKTLPSLKEDLCNKSLVFGMIRQLIIPRNWRYLLSRANLLSLALKEDWGVSQKLSDLPDFPEWSINGTTAETGRRFRFKKENFGEYSLGYGATECFPLSDAISVSAAFPGAIGPLVIDANQYTWKKREWDEPPESSKSIKLPYDFIHVYDGGVYDNLGLEPYYDQGSGNLKPNISSDTWLVVSDAGAPLLQGFQKRSLSPWRIKRVMDIMSEQARALRVRSLYGYLNRTARSTYIYIAEPSEKLLKADNRNFSASFPTTLRRLKEYEFEAICEHGYEVARSVFERR